MDIEFNNTVKDTTFKEMREGDVFADCTNPNRWDVYLVLKPDYGLGKDEDENDKYAGYAVQIASGEIFGFDADEVVYKVDAKTIISVSESH